MSQKKRQRKDANQPVSWLHQSPQWPLYESLLSLAWNEGDSLPTMLVARQSPRSGKIAAASFMVDLHCMGVKSTFVRICKSADDYEKRMRTPLFNTQYMEDAPLNLIAKIIREGLAFGERLGFSPDPEFHQARRLLGDVDPDTCDTPVHLGDKDGKPLYIPGPHDDVEHVLATLTRTVGPEGFTFREEAGPLSMR